MGKKDLVQLAVGFVVVALLALIAILFPVYGVYQNLMAEGITYVRRPIWDPPNVYVWPVDRAAGVAEPRGPAAGVDPADGAAGLAEVIPPNMKATPIFMDPMRGALVERKNVFGTLTACLVIAYLVFAVWKLSWRG